MKQFKTIFSFEFKELIKAKAFIITTFIVCLAAVLGLCFPLMFGEMENPAESAMQQYSEESTFVLCDTKNVLPDTNVIQYYFPNAHIKTADSEKKVKQMVKEDKADAGFIIHDDLNFTYYVENSDMMDMRANVFAEVLSMNYKNRQLMSMGLSGEEAMQVSSAAAVYEVETLGNDGANNIIYTFILIFAIYMVIIMYGNIIATSVASEKGNRTMELLATSASPTALIFGKVLAGCLAASLQMGLFIGSAFITYSFTKDAWNGMLDMLFDIPMEVLGAFGIFGILGFIFYAFIFGALGALVSKSEDVNSSATPITIIFVVVYLVVYIGIMSPDSTVFKIASFIPFSSPMAMFARMAMVKVPFIEVMISLLILVVSTVAVGWGASKIYRRATLMYGNQIKLRHAFGWLGKKDI